MPPGLRNPNPAFTNKILPQPNLKVGRNPHTLHFWWLAKSARLKQFSCTTHSIQLAWVKTLNLLVHREQQNKREASPPIRILSITPKHSKHSKHPNHPKNKLS
jgi:hypothetical protein